MRHTFTIHKFCIYKYFLPWFLPLIYSYDKSKLIFVLSSPIFAKNSRKKWNIHPKKGIFYDFSMFFYFTSNVIILAQAALDEIFSLKLTSYLSPKAIILFSFCLGHHFWSSVPFGITESTYFIVKSFHPLKYSKKLCLAQGGIYCCLFIKNTKKILDIFL